jgi:hypothetical protein
MMNKHLGSYNNGVYSPVVEFNRDAIPTGVYTYSISVANETYTGSILLK